MADVSIDTICKVVDLPKDVVESLLRAAANKSILCPASLGGDVWTTGAEGNGDELAGLGPAENIQFLVDNGGIPKDLGDFCVRVVGLMNNGGANALTLEELKKEYDELFNLPPREQARATAELLLRIAPQVIVYEGESAAETIYKVVCYKKVITLDGVEIMDFYKFNSGFFARHGVSFPPVSKGWWAKIITCWRTGVKILPSPDVSPELEAVDAVKNYLKSAILIADIGPPRFGYVYAVEGEVYVPSQTIQQILANINSKVTMRRLHYVMSDYVLSNTVAKKVPVGRGGGLYRFWRFDPHSIEVEMSAAVRLEEETPPVEKADTVRGDAEKIIREAFVNLGLSEAAQNDLAAALEDLGVEKAGEMIEKAVEDAVILRTTGGMFRLV